MENLQSLPQEILGEILSFLQLKDVCNLASTSARWNALAWSKITHIDIPDILQQPLAILRKCSAKSINSLALDLTDDKVANMEDYIACLNDFKKLTGLQASAPASENGQLYDAIYQLTQLKRLELVDNNRNFVEFDLFQRLTRMKNLTELAITVEMSLDSLPIEELTHLKTLKFPFSNLVDDSLLERALTLTGLEFLDLTWCQKITHNSFSKIVAMTNLTKLDVSRCLDILARSFELLKDLPRLWCLDLSYHHTLSSKEMKVICELPHVTCLYLVSNNGLESEANQYIARMTNLQELHLEGRSRSLSLLTGLTNLRILATGVLEDRPCIATLTNLVQLSIFDTSDTDLQWLSSMTWLSRLHIGGSKFSADSATQLTSLLPNCLITLPSKLK